MLLLIDAGNTRIKWALVALSVGELGVEEASRAELRWLAQGAIAHAQMDELSSTWAEWAAATEAKQSITRVLASNVAGTALRDRLQACFAASLRAEQIEWFVASESRAGVQNGYRVPTQLGSDRFAAAIGAHALYPDQPIVIATCGTATTVDAVSADGRFIGGMILPGLALMTSSLAKNTAQLPQVAAELDRAHLFADHTEAAIVSGCLSAQAGAIMRAVDALSDKMAEAGMPVQCVLSGGAAAYIAPHLPDFALPVRLHDNLVLRGLYTIAVLEGAC